MCFIVVPSALKFYSEEKFSRTQWLKLCNRNSFPIKYKIVVARTQRYEIVHYKSTVAPKAGVDILVRLRNSATLSKVQDMFMISAYHADTKKIIGTRLVLCTLLPGVSENYKIQQKGKARDVIEHFEIIGARRKSNCQFERNHRLQAILNIAFYKFEEKNNESNTKAAELPAIKAENKDKEKPNVFGNFEENDTVKVSQEAVSVDVGLNQSKVVYDNDTLERSNDRAQKKPEMLSLHKSETEVKDDGYFSDKVFQETQKELDSIFDNSQLEVNTEVYVSNRSETDANNGTEDGENFNQIMQKCLGIKQEMKNFGTYMISK